MLNTSISKFFPDEISDVINRYFEEDTEKKNNEIEEIRLRTDKPIGLKFNKHEKILEKIVTQEEVLKTIQYICDNSIYSYQKQISEGFITVRGGSFHGLQKVNSCYS